MNGWTVETGVMQMNNITPSSKKKTSISVREMRQILGLNKVESYWLVHQNRFRTIVAAGRMRIMLDSFEEWYAGQFHYKKVNGEAPGSKWEKTTMSIREAAALLGLQEATLFHALELCDDDNLALALNLAFSCSLRMGEMLALTWDCIDISAESISHDCASIFVNKELQRVQKQSLEMLDGKGVIKVFPSILVSKHTALVLKEPKTKTSIRKVFLPKTVAEMLLKRQAEQNELKELFGEEYTDYGLVFCSPMGTPIEGQVINRALNKLIEDNGLPKVVFHSLRHSSITYKLKLNGGDMKSVQGDSGHAQLKMVADVYSHIIDEDRRLNAKRFEDAFYSGHKTEDELDGLHARSIEQAAAPQPAEPETDQQLLLKLLNNPEMAALLKTLAKSL